MARQTILKIEQLRKQFTGVLALDDVTLSASGGEITGLIGVNGAGKSTLMNILGGIHEPTQGRIYINDEEIYIKTPQDAEKYGIGFIHQEPVMFNYMTVAENISISKMNGMISYKKINSIAKKCLDMLECDIKPTVKVGNLAIGDKQMVEIARALSTGGHILLFDEPTASFAYHEKERLFEVMRSLKERGAVIFFISHFLDEVEEITDKTIVLRDGRVVLSGKTKDIARGEILSNMVNGEVETVEEQSTNKDAKIIFKINNITRGNSLNHVDLYLKKGEIIGIWGLMGSGRTELMRAIYGLDKVDYGNIEIEDSSGKLKRISFDKVREYCGYVTESRHDDGLFLPWTIWENIASANLKQFKKNNSPFLDFAAQRKEAEKLVVQLNVKTPNVDVRMEQLSGGNQQKVIMAKWLLRNPKLFLLDEPTRGVDVGAKSEIHKMIKKLANTGAGVLVVSSEIEEIATLSDRVVILNRGKLVAQVSKAEIEKELLMSYCV